MKKKKKQNIILVTVGAVLIALVVGSYYSADLTRNKGFTFGNELQQIQEELKNSQDDFNSQVIIWREGDITKDEMLNYGHNHIIKLEELVLRYDFLSIPESFVPSVELFKLSTETQIQSDKQFMMWLETNEEQYKIRADNLLQDSFEYEMAALEKFNEAKRGIEP